MFKSRRGLIVKIRLFQAAEVLLGRNGGELFKAFDKMGLVIKEDKYSA